MRDQLAGDKASEALLGRLSPILDLGLFPTTEGQDDLDDFMRSSSVVRLGHLRGDETKNSVAARRTLFGERDRELGMPSRNGTVGDHELPDGAVERRPDVVDVIAHEHHQF